MMDITMALPVFNEQETLEEVVVCALRVLESATGGGKEVLIVNDGSTDKTGSISRGLESRFPLVSLHEHPSNLGFAEAQRSCYRHAGFDWVFLVPADGQIDPTTLLDFIPHCRDHDLVLGVAGEAPERGLRRILSKTYHALVRRLFRLQLGDFGACLMVRRSLVQRIELRSVTPVAMTELVVRSIASGAKVAQVEVDKKPRLYGTAKGGRMLSKAPRILIDLAKLYFEVSREEVLSSYNDHFR